MRELLLVLFIKSISAPSQYVVFLCIVPLYVMDNKPTDSNWKHFEISFSVETLIDKQVDMVWNFVLKTESKRRMKMIIYKFFERLHSYKWEDVL